MGSLVVLSRTASRELCVIALGAGLVNKLSPAVFSGPGMLPAAVSQRASPEVADFWFPAPSPRVSRPGGMRGGLARRLSSTGVANLLKADFKERERGRDREERGRDGSALLCLLESPPSCSSQAGAAFPVLSALCACLCAMAGRPPDVMDGVCLL